MNRRLRKKKRVGAFQELGFKVAFHMRDGLSPDEREELLDAFIHDAIEANGLSFGGGGHEMVWDGFVCRAAPRTSATHEDREAVERWLSSHRRISSYRIGALRDAWYGWT